MADGTNRSVFGHLPAGVALSKHHQAVIAKSSEISVAIEQIDAGYGSNVLMALPGNHTGRVPGSSFSVSGRELGCVNNQVCCPRNSSMLSPELLRPQGHPK
jgi:hypothetical protein